MMESVLWRTVDEDHVVAECMLLFCFNFVTVFNP